MNKKAYVLSVLLLMATTLSSGQGFRNYPWGTSKSAILNKETLKPDGDTRFNSFLLYRGVTVSGNLYADASYNFDESKLLISGSYWFGDRLSEKDWDRLMKVLTEKYGKIIQKPTASNSLTLIEYHWQNKDTHILASSEKLFRENDRNIIYYSLQEWNKLKIKAEIARKKKPITDKQGL